MLLPLLMNAYRMLGQYREGPARYDHALRRMTRYKVFCDLEEDKECEPVDEVVVERVIEEQVAKIEAIAVEENVDTEEIAARVAAAVVSELRRIIAEEDEDEEIACICLLH